MSKGRGEDRMAAWLKSQRQRAERDATVTLRYDPKRAAAGNQCPDFIIEMEVKVPLFDRHVVVVRAPILIEVEAGAGLEGALADLDRFVDRSTDGSGRQAPAIELPFVAATLRDGEQRTETVRTLPVRFRAVEIALPGGTPGREDREGEE